MLRLLNHQHIKQPKDIEAKRQRSQHAETMKRTHEQTHVNQPEERLGNQDSSLTYTTFHGFQLDHARTEHNQRVDQQGIQ